MIIKKCYELELFGTLFVKILTKENANFPRAVVVRHLLVFNLWFSQRLRQCNFFCLFSFSVNWQRFLWNQRTMGQSASQWSDVSMLACSLLWFRSRSLRFPSDDGRTKPRSKKNPAGDEAPTENLCLIRATRGSKKISTVVSFWQWGKFKCACGSHTPFDVYKKLHFVQHCPFLHDYPEPFLNNSNYRLDNKNASS